MKKILILTFALSSFTGAVFAQDLSDRTIAYSDLKVKCKSVDKSLSLYLTAKGNINRSQGNSVTLAVYTSKHVDWLIANKKMGYSKGLYNNWRSYTYEHKDPFNFEYKVEFEKMAYFENGKKTKAILTRVHKHPEVEIDQKFNLDCVTSVKVSKVGLKPITTARFNRLSEEHQAYVLTEIADAYSGRDSEPELTPAQEDLYGYFDETGTTDIINSLEDIKKLTKISKKQRAFLRKLKIQEEKDNTSCVEAFLDMHGYDRFDSEVEEALENWDICSFELSVVRDVNKVILGFVVNRFNDNGVDDSDGHDGSVTTYTSKGVDLGTLEWQP